MPKLLVITGETSGDLHASKVIKELKTLIPDLKIFGIGGERLEAEGVALVYNIKDLAVVGFLEIIPKFFRIRQVFQTLYKKMLIEQPDLCLLIDYPGFNMRFAKVAKKAGIKVVYYILPQVWAWGRGRIKTLEKYVDKGISILPFEKELYKNIPIEFVGHPLLDEIQGLEDNSQRITNNIALLPGSRKEEIKRILPVMLDCVKELNDFNFILPVADGIDKNWVEQLITRKRLEGRIKIVQGDTYTVLKSSLFALLKSGTCTLESCILETPMVIVYRVSPVSYFFAHFLVNLQWIGLPNIIAGEEIVPELIQANANSRNIIEAIDELNKNRDKIVLKLKKVKSLLGEKGASQRAAMILSEYLTAVSVPLRCSERGRQVF